MSRTTEPGRVLHVVDESPTVRFEPWADCTVETVTNAAEARARLAEAAFDCVVVEDDDDVSLTAVRTAADDTPVLVVSTTGTDGVADEQPVVLADPDAKSLAARVDGAAERRRATRRATSAERAYRLVEAVGRALAAAETRSEVDRRVCETVADAGPYAAVWIGDYDAERDVVTRRAAVGDDAGDLGDDIPADAGATGRAIRTGDVAVERGGGDTPDGEHGAVAAVPLRDDGTVTGVLHVATDRTDTLDERTTEALTTVGTLVADAVARAETRARRERRHRQFRSAVEHAGHVVLLTDADGRITYVNDAFESVTGYTESEALGRSPALLQSGTHDETFYHDLWETILDGDVWQGEVVNERKDGEQYVVDQTIAPISDDDGEITGFVAINRDVSELKAYERELEAQNDRLKQYGETVAHDLRNPLAALDAELKQFRATTDCEPPAGDDSADTVDAAAVRELCANIDDTVGRMETLIEDLLTMAEHGQRVIDPEPVSLEAVATEAWTGVDAPDAELSVQDVAVDADPDRLRELLANLFRNSVEHGSTDDSDDGLHVWVSPLDFSPGFAVEDDGTGIPPDERDDVFERGFTTASDGTGFGLAIVERIADAHGWAVSVTEGRAGGARFEFRTDEGA